MKHLILIILTVVMALGGCMTTRSVDPTTGAETTTSKVDTDALIVSTQQLVATLQIAFEMYQMNTDLRERIGAAEYERQSKERADRLAFAQQLLQALLAARGVYSPDAQAVK